MSQASRHSFNTSAAPGHCDSPGDARLEELPLPPLAHGLLDCQVRAVLGFSRVGSTEVLSLTRIHKKYPLALTTVLLSNSPPEVPSFIKKNVFLKSGLWEALWNQKNKQHKKCIYDDHLCIRHGQKNKTQSIQLSALKMRASQREGHKKTHVRLRTWGGWWCPNSANTNIKEGRGGGILIPTRHILYEKVACKLIVLWSGSPCPVGLPHCLRDAAPSFLMPPHLAMPSVNLSWTPSILRQLSISYWSGNKHCGGELSSKGSLSRFLVLIIMSWPKSSFGFFLMMLQKNLKLLGQSNKMSP